MPKEDPLKLNSRFVTGNGKYIDDIQMDGLAFASILRSPYAHANILKIDCSRALKMHGVVGVFTGTDYKKTCKPFTGNYYPIAVERVRYVGEPVAVVVAKNRYIAEDALDEIDVEYDPLDSVVDSESALSDGAPLIHEGSPTNVAWKGKFSFGDFDAAKENADHLISRRFYYPRYASTPIETFSVIASFNSETGVLTTWSNAAAPFVPAPTAGTLGLPAEKVRHIIYDSGGSFGIKVSMLPYICLISAVSRELGVPAKWIETRREHLLASSHQADRICYVEAAVRRDGSILGLGMKLIDNIGAYLRFPEPRNLLRSLSIFTGCYDIPNIKWEGYVVFTNKCPTGANRGYGTQHHFFILERTLDIIAKTLGIDRIELRKKNFIEPHRFPYKTPTGSIYDSGNYGRTLDLALRTIGYDGLLKRKRELSKHGKYMGVGIACIIEPSLANLNLAKIANTSAPAISSSESATIRIAENGSIAVSIGASSQGQGHSEVIMPLVAEELSVSVDRIQLEEYYDSTTTPWTPSSGTYSSRFNTMGVGAVLGAVKILKEKLCAIAAKYLGVPPERIVLSKGKFHVQDDAGKSVSIDDLLERARESPESDTPLEATYCYEHNFGEDLLPNVKGQLNAYGTYANSTVAAVVEVDKESGVINIKKFVVISDSGKVLNHEVLTGLHQGGAAHGIGGALYEELAYDQDGQMLASTFADYLVPTAVEIPRMQIKHIENKSPFTPLGSKGSAEGPAISAPAAIANAVADALSDAGAEILEMPLTPERIWRLLAGKN